MFCIFVYFSAEAEEERQAVEEQAVEVEKQAVKGGEEEGPS